MKINAQVDNLKSTQWKEKPNWWQLYSNTFFFSAGWGLPSQALFNKKARQHQKSGSYFYVCHPESTNEIYLSNVGD